MREETQKLKQSDILWRHLVKEGNKVSWRGGKEGPHGSMVVIKNLQKSGPGNGKTENHVGHRTCWGMGCGKHNHEWKSFSDSSLWRKALRLF